MQSRSLFARDELQRQEWPLCIWSMQRGWQFPPSACMRVDCVSTTSATPHALLAEQRGERREERIKADISNFQQNLLVWYWCVALLLVEQGIQIIGLSPRAMRARIINQVAPHETGAANVASSANHKPLMSDLTEIIYAVQQPDGEKVNFPTQISGLGLCVKLLNNLNSKN